METISIPFLSVIEFYHLGTLMGQLFIFIEILVQFLNLKVLGVMSKPTLNFVSSLFFLWGLID